MKGNLLIVDDEELLLENLVYILRRKADAIFTATNGMEALAIIESQNIHCIVCDYYMPTMNGLELVQTLREKDIHTPFIFYSGNAEFNVKVSHHELNIAGFLSKPMLEGLEDKVDECLRVDRRK